MSLVETRSRLKKTMQELEVDDQTATRHTIVRLGGRKSAVDLDGRDTRS